MTKENEMKKIIAELVLIAIIVGCFFGCFYAVKAYRNSKNVEAQINILEKAVEAYNGSKAVIDVTPLPLRKSRRDTDSR